VQQSLLSDLQESEGAYLQVDQGEFYFLLMACVVEPAVVSTGVIYKSQRELICR
jgi:hypothetical protein